MKIVIDDKIPFIRGIFEPFAEVVYLPGGQIGPANVRDADVLIVRTRTRCDQSLLEGSSVRMIATATIGFDHIDMDFCRAHGIEVATAAGCNARAVAQWVFAALIAMGASPGQTLGVVGVGNVGSVVSTIAGSAGFRVLLCDPPRAARGEGAFVPLEELLGQSDVVTLHVPLDDSTRDMASGEFFGRIKPGALFLNSSRGEVVDESALIGALDEGRISKAALDVWRNEPGINLSLLSRITVATPHIAGYSLQGKAMGTAMVVRAVSAKFGLNVEPDWYPTEAPLSRIDNEIGWEEIVSEMPSYYDILRDDRTLRNDRSAFESLRSDYRFRNEFF